MQLSRGAFTCMRFEEHLLALQPILLEVDAKCSPMIECLENKFSVIFSSNQQLLIVCMLHRGDHEVNYFTKIH